MSQHAKPIIKKMHWPYPLIWIVPVVAAIVAIFYAVDEAKNRGTEITIQFTDASGLKPDNTTIAHLGVDIGKILSLELSSDQQHALVHIRLRRSAEAFAKTGALFWIVRPEISAESISGLTTLASGPYIEAAPGSGDRATQFTGLESRPLAIGDGLRITLHAPRIEHIQTGSAIYFRGVEVGIIQNIRLSENANGIDVQCFIRSRFSRLVHANSQFWVVNGADVKGGILTGIQVKLDSLRSLIAGGITFATPDTQPGDPNGQPVKPGAEFPLFNEPKKEWLDWSPMIPLPPDNSAPFQQEMGVAQAADTLRSATKEK